MAQAMTLISSQTLGAGAATVTFNSIPNTYRDLRLVMVWSVGTLTNSNFYVQLNGDTTLGNYPMVEMVGNVTTSTSSANNTTQGLLIQYFNTAYANDVKISTMDLMDYAQTDKHKVALTTGNSAGTVVGARAALWSNTAAVTSLAITCQASTYAAGSTFYLYGISG